MKSLFFAWPLMLAIAVTMLRPELSITSLPPREASWDEQVAAVRAGKAFEIVVTQQPIGDKELADLEGLSRLGELELGDHRATFQGLQRLASLPNLRRVTLRGRPVDDEMLAALCGIPTLRRLNLPQTVITDRGLDSLKQRPQLVQLRIGGQAISDEGMVAIAALPNLRALHLVEIPIADRGLAKLENLKSLESLYLDGAKITDAGIERLLTKLPGLHFHIDQQHHDRDPLRGTHPH
jgi:hypothetical protein